jgi:hypothetical protein
MPGRCTGGSSRTTGVENACEEAEGVRGVTTMVMALAATPAAVDATALDGGGVDDGDHGGAHVTHTRSM